VTLAGAVMKRGQHRERDVPANRCCQETNRIVIASNHDLGASRWRAAGLATAREDLDDDYASAAARAGARLHAWLVRNKNPTHNARPDVIRIITQSRGFVNMSSIAAKTLPNNVTIMMWMPTRNNTTSPNKCGANTQQKVKGESYI
jgi:hypothetical protein